MSIRLISWSTRKHGERPLTAHKSRKKPNVRDVARKAGVSVATVSRVLNGALNVSDDTRQHVESVIEAMQFVPSSAARAINSGRSRLVGALIPTLDHAIFARFIDAVEETLDQHGLSLIVANTGHDLARELEKAKKLLNIGVEGLIVSGITRAEGFEAVVQRYQVPVIATSYYDAAHTFPTVGYDNAAVSELALNHLQALGHKSIGVLSGPADDNDRTRARLEGLQSTKNVSIKVFETEMSFAGAADAVAQLLHQKSDATAILCLSDVLAQGAVMCLRSRGLHVPSEISVVGIDDLPSSASFDPPLTTVHLPVADMGHHTAAALATWIETGTVPDGRLLDTKLISRASAAPRVE